MSLVCIQHEPKPQLREVHEYFFLLISPDWALKSGICVQDTKTKQLNQFMGKLLSSLVEGVECRHVGPKQTD